MQAKAFPAWPLLSAARRLSELPSAVYHAANPQSESNIINFAFTNCFEGRLCRGSPLLRESSLKRFASQPARLLLLSLHDILLRSFEASLFFTGQSVTYAFQIIFKACFLPRNLLIQNNHKLFRKKGKNDKHDFDLSLLRLIFLLQLTELKAGFFKI